jgi:hypothetical protein
MNKERMNTQKLKSNQRLASSIQNKSNIMKEKKLEKSKPIENYQIPSIPPQMLGLTYGE